MAIKASVLRQQQAAKASGEPAWNVTVLAEGNSPETHTVYAPREGLAKTIAMAMYQQPLNGAGVRTVTTAFITKEQPPCIKRI